VKPIEKKNDVVLSERFLGIIEDEKGRTVITPEDRYVQGEFCRLGKVLFCYDDKVLIAGFDRKPHMVLAGKNVIDVPVSANIINRHESNKSSFMLDGATQGHGMERGN